MATQGCQHSTASVSARDSDAVPLSPGTPWKTLQHCLWILVVGATHNLGAFVRLNWKVEITKYTGCGGYETLARSHKQNSLLTQSNVMRTNRRSQKAYDWMSVGRRRVERHRQTGGALTTS